MFETMRRLHLRGPESLGIAVDADGAMLGPDCILVRRTAQGYLCVGHDEASALQDFLFGRGRESDWLFERCRLIAKALDNGEIALAQILGLAIPIEDLDGERLKRVARAAPFIKANFNPDEPRVSAGNPDGGQWTYGGGSAALDTKNPSRDFGGEGGGRDRKDRDLGGGDGTDEAAGDENAGDAGADLIPAAYRGHYHDQVVELLRKITIAGGGSAIARVPLVAINGTTAVADLIASVPGHGKFVI